MLPRAWTVAVFHQFWAPTVAAVRLKTDDSVTEAPSIIFVMADDLGSNDVGRWQGMVGDPTSLTPELDELADGGIVLTDW